MPKYIYFILPFLLCNLSAQNGDWLPVGTERVYSVSGIATLNGHTFIVHDNKRGDEIRIGAIKIENDQLEYVPMIWPHEKLPFDLEALSVIPNSATDMIAMESTGKCHWLVLDLVKMRFAYNGAIQLPDIKQPINLEGFDLVQVGQRHLAVWGHRGKSEQPGTLYWGWMDLGKYSVDPISAVDITVDWPTTHVRHIADLKIDDEGQCWVSATSDPGDKGPFTSAIYRVGRFDLNGNQVQFTPVKNNNPVFKFQKHKVEAFELIKNGITVATDDENYGGYVKKLFFK